MDNRYKIVISSRNVYKEIELSPDMRQMKVGTGLDCDVRLHKNLFFGQIELLFTKTDGEWTVQCSDNIYLTVGDIRKLMMKKLDNGDLLEVKYFESDNTVFFIDFLVDFDDGNIRYERLIDTYYQPEIHIGCAPDNTIILSSEYVSKDSIILTRKSENYILNIVNSSYGVLHNGKRAESGELIKNGDFISVSDFFFCIKDGRVWTQIKDGLSVNSVRYTDRPAHNGYPKFSRSTRLKTLINKDKIDILDPPARPEKPKNNLLMRLLPSMGMLVAAIFMASRGGSMIIFSAISGVMSVVTAVMGVVEGKKEFKAKTAERIETYNAYIERKKNEIEECREEELDALNARYISQPDEIERFDDFATTLFDRRKEDEDFLDVRLGTGAVESAREINYKKQEKLEIEDELQKLPAELCDEYKYIEDAPIVCGLKNANAIGIVGEEQFCFDFLKNLVVDIVARQYESDAKMVFVAEPEHKDRVYWFRFLPQVYCETIGSRTIVTNDESKNVVFEYIYRELTLRQQSKKYEYHMVIFVYDEYGFKNHPISKFVDEAGSLGITFVFFGRTQADIPMGCTSVINIVDAQNAELTDANGKKASVEFEYPRISEKEMQDIIDIMAPVYTEELSLEGTLTKNISMFELLNIIAVDDIDLEKRWNGSQVSKSMAAPLGVSKSGVVYLDLHDKAHGPHGLVAGTTGSGKSEILQTYVLAMATLFHPYEVGFVIIDFKGGGMVNQFRSLPHLVGAITNIDGKEIDRSLKSIKAELQKRQRYFAEADVNHIDKYITKYKKGEVSKPLPHLIIIVDEFAELKAEQPEFMKELISAARIGRSLGVHLILATQKPSGQVNEQIWSNSRFKLCLKVQSQEDSNEVLKSPLAAEIKEPGRAYLQVGNNEIFELFQSAYSGAPEKTDDSKVKEFTIYSITDSGKRVPVYTQKKSGGSKNSVTQLDAIVGYVAKYCERNHVEKLPDICLPALEKVIGFPEKTTKVDCATSVSLGIYDDPDNQYQGEYSIDIASQNVMIIGSAQSGKTNLLQNIIRSIAENYSPSEVSVYIIDFASMTLKNFEKLNHVGGVVCPSDDEKLKNLFKLLNDEINGRKEKLISVGVSSFSAYREAGLKDIPHIVLIVDNLTALKELYLQEDDELLMLCREGVSVGITTIVANPQTSGIGYKYLSNFAMKIALFCNDNGEYGALFSHCRERLDNIPGRALIEIENEHYECQTYLAFEGEKEIERARSIALFVKNINEKYRGQAAARIPLIPASLTELYVYEQFYSIMQTRYRVVIGLDYSSVSPCVINLPSGGVIGISGREKSGKHNFVKYCVSMLARNFNGQTSVYVVDSIDKKLGELKEYENVKSYCILSEDALKMVGEVESILKARYDAMASGDDHVLEKSDLIVMIINNLDAVADISNDGAYKNICGRFKNMNVCIIVSCIENASIPYGAPEMLKGIRDNHNLVFFDDLANLKVFDVPLSAVRNFKKPIEVGDGYYIKDNSIVKIKTPIHQKY